MGAVAMLMNISSAIGALQHCRANNIYTGKPDLVQTAFDRMSALMSPLVDLPAGDKGKKLAEATFMTYAASGRAGVLVTFSPIPGDSEKLKTVTVEIKGETVCKAAEKFLATQMEKGKTLGFEPKKQVGDL